MRVHNNKPNNKVDLKLKCNFLKAPVNRGKKKVCELFEMTCIHV